MEEVQVDKSLKQLKEALVSLGMPQTEVDGFNTKAQILAVINTLKAKEVVKRVDSLEEKETPVEKRVFERQYISKATIMRDKLASQPKVRVMIPLEGQERQGIIEWRTDKHGQKYQFVVSGDYAQFQFNGYKYLVAKGVYQDVPEQVAKQIEISFNQTVQAGANISLDRVDPRTGKPMSESI